MVSSQDSSLWRRVHFPLSGRLDRLSFVTLSHRYLFESCHSQNGRADPIHPCSLSLISGKHGCVKHMFRSCTKREHNTGENHRENLGSLKLLNQRKRYSCMAF
jgi:hypothetical protein